MEGKNIGPQVIDVTQFNVASSLPMKPGEFFIPLTVTDVALAHRQITTAFHFTEHLDDKELQKRLSIVLQAFGAFSGEPDLPSSSIKVSATSTVPFVLAKCDAPAEVAIAMQHPGNKGSTVLSHIYCPIGVPWKAPLFSVKLTLCSNGHSILAFALSHLAGDGEALWTLIRMLDTQIGCSELCKSATASCNDRKSVALLGMSRGMYVAKLPKSLHFEVRDEPLVTALFVVPSTLIEHVKDLVLASVETEETDSGQHATYVSTVDIMTSMAWMLFREAQPGDMKNCYTLSVTISLRRPKALPSIHSCGVVGNAVFSVYVDPQDGYETHTLDVVSVASAARAIRSKILQWRTSVRSILQRVQDPDFDPNSYPELELPTARIFNVTSWADAPTDISLQTVEGVTATPIGIRGSTLSGDPSILESPPYRGYVMPRAHESETRNIQLLCPVRQHAWLCQRWEKFLSLFPTS